MKNSPHRRKHMQQKAIKAASHIQLYPSKKAKILKIESDGLRPLNVKRCIDILNVYKKHLEELRFYKHPHHARWTTTQGVEGKAIGLHEKNPNKISAHWKASGNERSKEIARKMLKNGRERYKKAA